ncbi:MAG: ankyrin repeat domain-containing protein [Rickettsia endosymbiont of Glossina mortisans submortisans]|nr:ankyrin repeat domain-containing protein [Rickettsia endosymbiont of Glossina mortisans submortisans]
MKIIQVILKFIIIFIIPAIHAMECKLEFKTQKIYVDGIEYNQKVGNPIIPIADAIKADNLEEVKKILDEGYGVNQPCLGWVPLDYAISNNNIKIADFLLKRGASMSLIHINIGFMKSEIAEFLINQGMSPNLRYEDGITGMMLAAERNNPDLIKLLLKLGVNPNVQNSKTGMTSLMYAASYLNVEPVRILLEYGADQKIKDFKGKKALDWIAVDASRKLYASDAEYYTALFFAPFETKQKIIKERNSIKTRNKEKEKEIKKLFNSHR